MLYRIRLDIAFDNEDVPQTIYSQAEQALSEATKIVSKDNTVDEVSFIEIHKCYHDEDTNKPCEVIRRIEL
jgi:hypothetical protein